MRDSLIKRCCERGYPPGSVLLDSGYENNTSLLIELEKKNLKYLGGLAKNRKVSFENKEKNYFEIRLDKLFEKTQKVVVVQKLCSLICKPCWLIITVDR